MRIAQRVFVDPIHYAAYVPEIARFADKRSRIDAFREAFRYAANRSLMAWAAFPLAILLALGVRQYSMALPRTLRILMIVIIVGLFLATVLTAIRKRLRHHLRKQLVARGELICIDCGYDLRGLTTDRCPECGNAIREQDAVEQGEGKARG